MRFGGRLLLSFLLALVLADLSQAQSSLRRHPPVQPVAEVEAGEFLVGLGFGRLTNVRFPILDLRGDITRFLIFQLAYAPADGIVIEFRGDVLQTLFVDEIGEPLVEPDDGLADGVSTGATGLRIDALFRLLGRAVGPSGGIHLGFKIPNGNQREGLDTNSGAIRISALASYGGGPLRVTADLGLAILEAPLENFEQNDVFVYSAEALYIPWTGSPARLFVGLDGRASTRDRFPVGTEDLGEVRAGAEYGIGPALIDIGTAFGFAGISPSFGISGGVSFATGRS